MTGGNEQTALMLSQGMYSNDKPGRSWDTVLQLACKATFVELVRELLERGPRQQTEKYHVRDHSAALHELLDRNACHDQFIERNLLEDVYQITSLLIEHDADPDMTFDKTLELWSATAREAAACSRDPCIRNLLLAPPVKPVVQPKGHMSRIAGPLWKKKKKGFEDPAEEALGKYRASIHPHEIQYGRTAPMVKNEQREPYYSMSLFDLARHARLKSSTKQSIVLKAPKAKVNPSSTTTQLRGYQDVWAQKTGGPASKTIMPEPGLDTIIEGEPFPSIEKIGVEFNRKEDPAITSRYCRKEGREESGAWKTRGGRQAHEKEWGEDRKEAVGISLALRVSTRCRVVVNALTMSSWVRCPRKRQSR